MKGAPKGHQSNQRGIKGGNGDTWALDYLFCLLYPVFFLWTIDHGLPEPDFSEEHGVMKVVFYQDKWNENNLKKLGLNERQTRAVMYVKEKGKITNKEYTELNNVSRQTATRDLTELVNKEILTLAGKGKRDLRYILII